MTITRQDLEIINKQIDDTFKELEMIKKNSFECLPMATTIEGDIYSAMYDKDTNSYYIMRVNKDFTPLDVIFEGTKDEVSVEMIEIIKKGKL